MRVRYGWIGGLLLTGAILGCGSNHDAADEDGKTPDVEEVADKAVQEAREGLEELRNELPELRERADALAQEGREEGEQLLQDIDEKTAAAQERLDEWADTASENARRGFAQAMDELKNAYREAREALNETAEEEPQKQGPKPSA